MTVAALILAASPESALRDAAGTPAVRRSVDTALTAGVSPIVVLSFDPDGDVARALAGSAGLLGEPAPREDGPVGQISRAFDLARANDAGITGALVWPARIVWVRPDTIGSLIEAHGTDREKTLVPTHRGERGWPVVLPATRLAAFRRLDRTLMPGDLFLALATEGVPERTIEIDNPGTTQDIDSPPPLV